MADSGSIVPGLSNKYNSQATIEKIMNKKREKVDKMNDEKKKIDETRQSMGEVGRKVLSLDKSAKRLYGSGSSFENKVAESGSTQISAKTEKTADRGVYSVHVIEKASSHKIASSSLSKKQKIEAGNYQINSGEESVTIRFAGGSLESFHKAILDQGKDVIKSSIIYDTPKTVVFVLESKSIGEKSKIVFSNDESKVLFKKLGFYAEKYPIDKEFSLSDFIINSSNQSENNFSSIELEEFFQIENNQSCFLNLSKEKIQLTDSVYLDLNCFFSKPKEILPADDEEINNKNNVNSNGKSSFSEVGKSTIMGVELPGDKFLLNLPEQQNEESSSNKSNEDDVISNINNNYLSQNYPMYQIEIKTSSGVVSLENLPISDEKKIIPINLSEILSSDCQLMGISFKNMDSQAILNVGKVRIYTKLDAREGIQDIFANELTKAQDSILELDGLQVIRTSNVIDDLLKGVSLTILGKTDEAVSLNVDYDYPKIVGDITDFLSEYNQLIDMINTRTSFVSSDDSLSEEEKEQRKGSLNSELELKTLASKLRTIIMNSYPTKYGAEFSMLSQIGVSTNETGGKDKLRGLLEFDEDKFIDKFIEVMEKYPDGVRELFAKDTNQDFVPDTGIALEINRLLKGYMEKSVGYFDTRDNRLKNLKENKQKEIDRYEEKLDQEERKLKEQFFKMEKAGQELENNQKKFDNLGK